MTTMTRASFDARFTAGTLDDLTRRAAGEGVTLTAAQRRSLGRADLDGNGVIGDSARERRAVWGAVDSFDRNGSRGSVSSRTGGGFRLAQGLAPGATTGADPARAAGGAGAGGAGGAGAGAGTSPVTAGTPRVTTSSSAPVDPVERDIQSNDRSAAALTRSAEALERYARLPEDRRTPELRAAVAHMVDTSRPLADAAPPIRLVAATDDQSRRLLLSEHDYAAAAARFNDAARAAGF